MVIVLPYRSAEKVKQIEHSFEQINMQCLGLQNARYLSTKELTADEKNNRQMDYLGGFELIDKEMRMYVFEGVGGVGKSMHRFYQINEREHSNDRRFKMIFNPEITFKHRLY